MLSVTKTTDNPGGPQAAPPPEAHFNIDAPPLSGSGFPPIGRPTNRIVQLQLPQMQPGAFQPLEIEIPRLGGVGLMGPRPSIGGGASSTAQDMDAGAVGGEVCSASTSEFLRSDFEPFDEAGL